MKTIIITALIASAVCFSLPVLANHEHVDKMLEKADTNHDGSISEDEFMNCKKDHFKKADKDGNGSLDKKEQELLRDEAKEDHKMHKGKD